MTDPLENAREYFQAGIRRYEASDFEGAARAFKSALALSPDRPSALDLGCGTGCADPC